MDPNENLEETRDLAEKLHDVGDVLVGPVVADADDALRLCELTRALDQWVMRGGFLPEEWGHRCNGGLLKRATLAVQVYDHAMDGSETFEGELGVQLAYLFGAILKGTHISLDMKNDEENEVHQFLEVLFPPEHAVWGYIEVENLPEDKVSSG
jgi:hypothetical protein